jgi:hypothetical protein
MAGLIAIKIAGDATTMSVRARAPIQPDCREQLP